MTFTIIEPGTVIDPPAPAQTSLPRLGKVWRAYTSPSCYEPVKAVTEDGQWLFERAQDGTWDAGHLPTETVVKAGLRTLRACRVYAGSGKAAADLGRIKAAVKGEGNG